MILPLLQVYRDERERRDEQTRKRVYDEKEAAARLYPRSGRLEVAPVGDRDGRNS